MRINLLRFRSPQRLAVRIVELWDLLCVDFYIMLYGFAQVAGLNQVGVVRLVETLAGDVL